MSTTRIPLLRLCSDRLGIYVALSLSPFRVSAGRLIGRFWIEQLGEPRIVGHVLEVRIIAGLKTVLRIHADGIAQISKGAFHLTSQAVNHGHAVKSEVGFGILFQDLF